MSVNSAIKSIQDIMRQDAGVDGDAQRISQLVWMIFLKIFDDKEKEYETFDKKYESPLPDELRWRNWAADDEGITGDGLLDFINNKLFRTLKSLSFKPNDDPRGFIIKEVFEDSYNYMKSGTLIRQVINKINEIDFNNKDDKHLFGDIYEQILKDLQSAGNAGEYYTPRAVTQFIVEMVEPKLGEKILDPACGTGGFLTNAIDFIRKSDVKTASENKILQNSIAGVEKKPLPHLLAITNMILHGIETPQQIKRDNLLSKPLREYGSQDRVDVILTNPPFGGVEEDGIEHNFPTGFRTKETADLFLLLIIQLLRDGGRAGIVLPDGSLSGNGVKTRIKEKFLKECNLHTIIRLPNSVFKPYATINTNLLFFTKGEPTKDIWYFEHQLPSGTKSYSKTNPISIDDFKSEKEWWSKRVNNSFAWKVSIKEIMDRNYDLDIKNPNLAIASTSENPKAVLNEMKRNLIEIDKLVSLMEKEYEDFK